MHVRGPGFIPAEAGCRYRAPLSPPIPPWPPPPRVGDKGGVYIMHPPEFINRIFHGLFPIGGSAPALAQKGAPGPSVRGRPPSLDVHMVVDMLHAVAVVAVAFGTVAELHVGVVRVGDAAHGAFVEIALSVLDFLLSLFLKLMV